MDLILTAVVGVLVGACTICGAIGLAGHVCNKCGRGVHIVAKK